MVLLVKLIWLHVSLSSLDRSSGPEAAAAGQNEPRRQEMMQRDDWGFTRLTLLNSFDRKLTSTKGFLPKKHASRVRVTGRIKEDFYDSTPPWRKKQTWNISLPRWRMDEWFCDMILHAGMVLKVNMKSEYPSKKV